MAETEAVSGHDPIQLHVFQGWQAVQIKVGQLGRVRLSKFWIMVVWVLCELERFESEAAAQIQKDAEL